MRACVKPANGKVEIIDIPTPEPGPCEMIVKTSMATVCGSDMHFLDEFPNEMLGALFVGSVLPQGLLMGHEGVGTVHAVGEGVSRFREGDRVMASCLVGCGKCRECMTVDHSVCTGGGRVLFGCQAEYYKVPFADVNAAKVPDSPRGRWACAQQPAPAPAAAGSSLRSIPFLSASRCRSGSVRMW